MNCSPNIFIYRRKIFISLLWLIFLLPIKGYGISQYVGVPFYLDGPSYSGVLDKSVWSTDDNNYISISQSGVGATIIINAYFTGTKTATCYYAYHYYIGSTKYNEAGHFDVDIQCLPSTTVLNKTEINIGIGETVELSYTNNKADKLYPIWDSTDKTIATVNNGEWADTQTVTVKGISSGECEIVFKPQTENKKVSCHVIVNETPISSLKLSPEKLILTEGKSGSFNIITEPSYAKPTLEWKSSNTEIATVSKSGIVSAVSAGSTTITATYDNRISASATVEVVPLPKDVKLESEIIIPLGYSKRPVVTFSPSTSTATCSWKSSDSSIASVDATGNIKGLQIGECVITCTTQNKLSATARIIITEAPNLMDARNVKLRIDKIEEMTKETFKNIK